jgi:hypothetical protein
MLFLSILSLAKMKKIAISNILLPILLALVISCSNEKKNETKINKDDQTAKAVASINSSFLNDKNYLYQNIKITEGLKFIGKRLLNGNYDNHLYADSAFKRFYIELDKNQKGKLIASFISKMLKVDASYPVDLMKAFFVSKQDKIGDLQPIIVHIGGDDYSSLTMILLDENNNFVSGYNISGGMDSGPEEKGDSLISFEATSYSHLNDNKITTFRINETDHTDSTKKEVIIDSNVFVSVIGKAGKIVTKQTVKAHFLKSK